MSGRATGPLCGLAAAGLLAASCSGAREIGVKGHDEAAAMEELRAAEEQRRYDPKRTSYVNECPFSAATHSVPCWTADRNPTAVHLQEAQRHRDAARAHRARSAALREAEARACAGLTEHDRDTSPFSHTADVASVAALRAPVERDRDLPARQVGVAVGFRPVEGLSREKLQQLVDCHLARNAALGFGQSEEPHDPLDVPGASARVVPAGQALRVEIRAADQAAAREMLNRALQLTQ